jgi:hypothetical protein
LLFNEVAQWAVLVFLAVFVFGLTRQLGFFLTPQKERLLNEGPEVGKVLPEALVENGRGETLTRLVRSSTDPGLAAIFVIEEDCPACKGLLAHMEERDVDVGMPMAALLKGDPEAEFGRRVRKAFPTVIEDDGGGLARRAGIDGTPFLLVVDEGLVLRHKDWGGNLFEGATKWLAAAQSGGNGADGAESAVGGDRVAAHRGTVVDKIRRRG